VSDVATTATPPRTPSSDESACARTTWRRWLANAESQLIKLSDRGNAILVKETRQALKSRQFVVSFLVVLIASWVATIGGVAVIGPEIYYAASGSVMLVVYYCILAFPLAVVVPYTAFRSIATEREDNTYDLLSITTLTAKRIVTGKLLSAALQMLVFLSAVSPCIAFTYLLRGVDARTLAMVLGLAVVGSLGLSMIGLFVGSLTHVRYAQIFLSVALIVGLMGAFMASIGIVFVLIDEGYLMFRDVEFYWIMAGLALLYVTTFGLFHAAAAAQIAFSSENRSTPLRWWMIVQTACLVGWLASAPFVNDMRSPEIHELIIVGGVMAGSYWWVMGALVVSEWPLLSVRVKRSLPQSTIGRALLTWFNPGPGTGYMFLVSNVTALAMLGLALVVFNWGSAPSWISSETCAIFCILIWGYFVAYLGLGRLLISLLRRFAYVPLAGGFLIHIILLLIGIGTPIVIQMIVYRLRYSGGYSIMHLSNPVWTGYQLVENGSAAIQGPVAVVVVAAVAVGVLLLNLRGVAAEVVVQRSALPARVVEEEAELHPEPPPRPTNPWDVDAAGEGRQFDAAASDE